MAENSSDEEKEVKYLCSDYEVECLNDKHPLLKKIFERYNGSDRGPIFRINDTRYYLNKLNSARCGSEYTISILRGHEVDSMFSSSFSTVMNWLEKTAHPIFSVGDETYKMSDVIIIEDLIKPACR